MADPAKERQRGQARTHGAGALTSIRTVFCSAAFDARPSILRAKNPCRTSLSGGYGGSWVDHGPKGHHINPLHSINIMPLRTGLSGNRSSQGLHQRAAQAGLLRFGQSEDAAHRSGLLADRSPWMTEMAPPWNVTARPGAATWRAFRPFRQSPATALACDPRARSRSCAFHDSHQGFDNQPLAGV